jgi:pimeloyl-ACP methyl ester carboxylesterase
VDTFTLPDGRAMAYHVWGEAGAPVLIHQHGVPGSRLELMPAAEAIAAGRLRVVAPDRPGIGRSDPAPGRGMTAYSEDTVALADHLGVDRFVVSGFSAGGPYALAAAVAHPSRVAGALLMSSAGDPSTPGADEGVVWSERALGWLARKHPAIARGVWRLTAPTFSHAPRLATKQITQSAPCDAEFFAEGNRTRAVAEDLSESLHQGTAAMVEDYARCYEPWDFDPTAARVPVIAWHGESDQLCPIRLAEHLQGEIPGAQLRPLPGTGHMGVLRIMDDVLAAATELLRPRAAPPH